MFWRLAKPAGIEAVDAPPLTASAPVRVSTTATSVTSAANVPLPFAVKVGLADAYVLWFHSSSPAPVVSHTRRT